MEPECSLFLPWNLESWALEYGIQVQLINNPESSTWNPESMAWIPEFKSVLGSLTWGNHLIFKYLTPPSVMKPATRKDYPLHSFIYFFRQFVIESKQRRFWATVHVNRKWNFCTLEPWFWTNFWANPLYKNNTLDNTNMVESRLIKREKGSLQVDVSLKNVTA